MKRLLYLALTTLLAIPAMAGEVSFGKGTLSVRQVARNAVRIQYYEQKTTSKLPDWLYVKNDEVSSRDVTVDVDEARQTVIVKDRQGTPVFTATLHQMKGREATLAFRSDKDEHLYGLGQFQDGYSNVRGLSRRLTQVNTKSAFPCSCRARAMASYGITTVWWTSTLATIW